MRAALGRRAELGVLTAEYAGLHRMTQAVTTNWGIGGSDSEVEPLETPIQNGNRSEHYYYTGWSMVEMRDAGGNTLGQFVRGITGPDGWVRYDRNTDVGTDNDCLDSDGSKSYYYHADRNTRVVMLSDTSGDVVERYEYDAYGNATILRGGSTEAGNVLSASSVGNPFLHQGLFFDRTIGSYQNRFRQYHSRLGRFMRRDPIGYRAGMNLYEYVHGDPYGWIDPLGLQERPPSTQPATQPSTQPSSQPGGHTVVPDSGTPMPKTPKIKIFLAPGYTILVITDQNDDGVVTNCYGYACESDANIQPGTDPSKPPTLDDVKKFPKSLGCKKKKGSCGDDEVAVRFYSDDDGNWHAVRLDGPRGKACAKLSPEGPVHEDIQDPDQHTKDNVNPDAKPIGDYCCPKRSKLDPSKVPTQPSLDPNRPKK